MDLCVTGVGMVTAVGHDVVTACAAVRAGIVRPRPLLHFPVLDEDTHESLPLLGYPVHGVTDGFGSVGRWLALAVRAIEDLVRHARLPDGTDDAFWSRTAVIFVTPDLESASLDFEGVVDPDNFHEVFVEPLLEETALPIAPSSCQTVADDNPGLGSACLSAQATLDEAAADRVLVIAVDSCLDGHSLAWLNTLGRLKLPGRPTGMIAGEAAAALLFETEAGARARGARPLLRILSVGREVEPANLLAEEPNTGVALSQCVRRALADRPGNAPFSGPIYVDLNGENWRALEYSGVRLRVPQELLSPAATELIPALSLGDVGAAAAACSLCMMVESARRGYALGDEALLIASSPRGLVTSLVAGLC